MDHYPMKNIVGAMCRVYFCKYAIEHLAKLKDQYIAPYLDDCASKFNEI